MSSKKIVITGGAGFVGTNLIKLLLKKTNYKLISIDDYSSSTRKNHIKDSKSVDYLVILEEKKKLLSMTAD